MVTCNTVDGARMNGTHAKTMAKSINLLRTALMIIMNTNTNGPSGSGVAQQNVVLLLLHAAKRATSRHQFSPAFA